MPYIKKSSILFDLSHNEMLAPDERDYSEFKDLLEKLSVNVKVNESEDISIKILKNIDILIIGNPIDEYFSSLEIKNIINFVREGGGLLLVSEYGSDYLQKTNLNDLSKNFGIYFEKNIIKEETKINEDCLSILSIQEFNDHKITNQLRDVSIGGSCSLSISDNSKMLIFANDEAWTEEYKNVSNEWIKEEEDKTLFIAACAEYGRGKVVALGDIDIFSNDPNIGIFQPDNRRFIYNILNWLIEPIKDTDVLAWTLNNIGSIQNEIKELNFKIGNIIETITGLEERISAIEKSKFKGLEKQVDKKTVNRQEENPPLV